MSSPISLSALVRAGALDGATGGAITITRAWTVPSEPPSSTPHVDLVLEVLVDGAPRTLHQTRITQNSAWEAPASTARLAAALAAVGERRKEDHVVLEAILDALLEPPPEAVRAFVEETLAQGLRRDAGGRVFRATRGARHVDLYMKRLYVMTDFRRFGDVGADTQLVFWEGDALTDVKEFGPLYVGHVPRGPVVPSRETVDAAMAHFAAVFRAHVESRVDPALEVHHVWPQVDLGAYLDAWAAGGPTPPRPERFRHDPARIAEQATRLAAVSKARAREVAGPDAPPVVWAKRLDGWTMVVCIELEGEDWNDPGRIVIESPEGERAQILDYDLDGSQDFSAVPVDGDTVTMRGVLDWLRALLEAAGQDKKLKASEDSAAYGLRLGEWLRFRDRTQVRVDWRVQLDAVGEGPLRDGHDPALRARAPAAAALYERFVRALIDPSFVSRPSA